MRKSGRREEMGEEEEEEEESAIGEQCNDKNKSMVFNNNSQCEQSQPLNQKTN